MNPCVKTGVVFIDRSTGHKHTGDLFFWRDRGWQVRGVPCEHHDAINGPAVIDDIRSPHVAVDGVSFVEREGCPTYVDTCFGIVLAACDDRFREHVRDWYPELVDSLPVAPL